MPQLALACMAPTAILAHTHYHRHHRHVAHHHRFHRPTHRAPRPAPALFSLSFDGSLVSEARSTLGETAAELGVRRTLWCMAAVNHWLHHIGKRGSGSDAAFSALRLGPHLNAPQVGALAVMARRGGGHVGVVSGVTADGNPVIISGNHGHRVREAVYPRSRIRAYVVPE